ncbi:MAG TPA: phosphatase PAP2 family protein [Blastocatellia bacterium]|nr:phosphatase PAP2 family protein [Blastocatellia bacterium]
MRATPHDQNIPRRVIEPWRIVVCVTVLGFLALAVSTGTFKLYQLATLIAIPGALLAADTGRRFFFEWGPLMCTWLAYDRLRLVQPWLLDRVAVRWPYDVEIILFGWLAGGRVPAHAARAWLAGHIGSPFWHSASLALQVVYFSHLWFYPLLFLAWWIAGFRRADARDRARRHVIAFAILNCIGFACYIAVPAAPPWWVSLYGFETPTPALVLAANIPAAMDGAIVQRLLATAPNWFAAVPSLHGGYPVLLFLLAWRERRTAWMVFVVCYGAAMWVSTVVLNQHYIIDLLLGAGVAVVAFVVSERFFRAERKDAETLRQSL